MGAPASLVRLGYQRSDGTSRMSIARCVANALSPTGATRAIGRVISADVKHPKSSPFLVTSPAPN